MSNVLIGIIGVILFIGIALAGALILGEDFTKANNASRATAYIAEADQVAKAMALYQLKLGRDIPITNSLAFLTPRFLKVAPSGYSTFTGGGMYGTFKLYPLSDNTRRICEEIQRQTGMIGENDPFMDTPLGIQNRFTRLHRGCIVWTGANAENIAVWASI